MRTERKPIYKTLLFWELVLGALLILGIVIFIMVELKKPLPQIQETTVPTVPATSEVTTPPPETTQPVTEATTEATTEPTTAPTTEATTEPTAETTLPEHSTLYLQDLSVEDVILYFNEVCLDAEFNDGGDPKLIQKWDSPIGYLIQGDPTEADLEVLEGFVAWLNEMEGFPGLYPAEEEFLADLQIHFCSYYEMLDIMGDQFEGSDGCVTFWYNGDNIIYDATICCVDSLDQHIRNSVILEELYNGLGPVQDTWLRPDSLIYGGYSEPQMLTEIDELILKLLYHPDMRPGMTPEEAEDVIRQLYY